MIHCLPFDVLECISLHLSVQSLVSLQLTCKHLQKMIGERSVWIAVLRDILQVIPLHRVLDALPNMSSSELKQKAVLITRLDSLWNLEAVHPMKIASHSLSSDVWRVLIWPGGDFILKLLKDGTLQLYQNHNMTDPLVMVTRPDRISCNYYPSYTDVRLACNTRGETWAVVVDYYITSEGQGFTDFRAYLIDASAASICFLTTVTRPQYCPDYHAAGDTLVTVIKEDSTYLLAIRKMPFSADAIEEEAFLNLGHDFAASCTTMLCPHMVLVSTHSSLRLYQIPEFMPLGYGIKSHSNLATPIASHIFGKPNDGRLIWNALCPHLDGRMWTYTFSETENAEIEEALLISPLPGQFDKHDFIRHIFDGPCAMGSTRAIGYKYAVELRPIELHCFSPGTYHIMSAGYVRLGRIQASNPECSVSIPLPGYEGHIEDLAWDEESGRICAIYRPADDPTRRDLLMIDMI